MYVPTYKMIAFYRERTAADLATYNCLDPIIRNRTPPASTLGALIKQVTRWTGGNTPRLDYELDIKDVSYPL
jgi:hypothetical protein